MFLFLACHFSLSFVIEPWATKTYPPSILRGYRGTPWDGWSRLIAPWAFGIISAIAQVACLIHVYRTGRPYWWFWVILWFPGIGVGAYLLLELRPGWGKINWRSILWKLKSRAERIRILREQLEDSSTVANRLLLAEELFNAGRYDDVCQLLSEGLRGAFATDAEMLLQLAEAHLTAGRIDDASAALGRMEDERSRDVQFRRKLLDARILCSGER